MKNMIKVADAAANLVEKAHKAKQKKESPAEEQPESSSQEAQEQISDKMHQMKDEDRPQKQKVAIAMSEARKKGLKVPPAKK